MTTFDLDHGAIRSYKRLSYTTWHALAEFVDNSTQAFFDNEEELGPILDQEHSRLQVDISYDNAARRLTISDNSIGMDTDTLDRAMTVGLPPPNPSGRSRYGMGMKTAACWFGDFWTVTTTRLGADVELTVTVDVEHIAEGNAELPVTTRPVDPSTHYTVIEISQLHVLFLGRRPSKTKDYLVSIYREDLRSDRLELFWQGDQLQWQELGRQFLLGPDGQEYRKQVSFNIGDKTVSGWVGVLSPGGRALAGFSMFHSGRMVRGYPDSWRPQEVFGQEEGSNNLVNQRLVGEFHLDDFPVTHTKDDILWSDEEELAVERTIYSEISDYLHIAEHTRLRDRSGPQRGAIRKASRTIQEDISKDRKPAFSLTPDLIEERRTESSALANRYSPSQPDVTGEAFGRTFRAYFTDEEGSNAIFAALSIDDSNSDIVVVANLRHPFLDNVSSSEALDIYLRGLLIDVGTKAEIDGLSNQGRWLAAKDLLMRAFASNGETQ
ncbi:ATP-binding protein [Candidatus Poriferisocius sp.]|uniref:ATP-binding protein n=1 Tax=Candidatus Poriferisocius sp. TaxID=3101276 RepID=UPI003B022563